MQSIYFPVSCGHRKLIFTGTSSKSLQEILLCVGQEIPTEEELLQLKERTESYLNDIKVELEKAAGKQMKLIFSGSTVERYGIPVMLLSHSCCAGPSLGTLHTDLDVMICPMAERACFSGQGYIHLAPLFIDGVRVIGYTKLFRLTSMCKKIWIRPRVVIKKVKDAVTSTPLLNFPENKPWCVLAPRIEVQSKGPALKIRVLAVFELDVTFCFYCPEWPTNSDWPSRPRYWPSMADAQRIMSLGCHVVAKSAPCDKENKSWRFSFSVAECELSKLVPDTAKKCFLALKIILKDHLQPVVPEIGSYHIKTIFLNTMEKLPVGFWADENIERCFLTLLKELRIALRTMKCPHHWFSSINLFSIKAEKLQLLAKKVQRILQDPSPFILDDGCCCVSSCCVRVPDEHFTSRDIQEIIADYEESPICVRASDDGMCRENNFVDLWHDVNSPNVHKVSVKVTPNKEQNPSQRMEDHQILADDLDLLIQDV